MSYQDEMLRKYNALVRENEGLRTKVAELRVELREHHLQKMAEQILLAAYNQPHHAPQTLVPSTITDFCDKRAHLVRSGPGNLQKTAALIEFSTEQKFRYGIDEESADVAPEDDPYRHIDAIRANKRFG
jgi:hypothetical protein